MHEAFPLLSYAVLNSSHPPTFKEKVKMDLNLARVAVLANVPLILNGDQNKHFHFNRALKKGCKS